jgi:CubicO group peptidase (beta-lactamase class C family)
MSRLYFLLLFILFLLSFSCTDNPTESIPAPTVPADLGDGWPVASVSDEGLAAETITWMSETAKNGNFGQIHCILIVRNGKLIFEAYYGGYHVNRLHPLASVTKSVVSVLMGIAVDKGYIADIDSSINEYFPQYSDIFSNEPQKNDITIRHLLTMSAGFDWDEWSYPYTSALNSYYQMERSSDWTRFVLALPLIHPPGSMFTYNSGNSILQGDIIHHLCGQAADQWAESVLFGPLGITTYSWATQKNGLPQTGGGLSLRPRDLAKIGFLLINEGKWQNQQIISQSWIEQSVIPAVTIWPGVKYGFNWWLRPLPDMFDFSPQDNDIIHGVGYAGQYLFIIPRLDMMVLCTSWNENELESAPLGILYNFVLPAIDPDSI